VVISYGGGGEVASGVGSIVGGTCAAGSGGTSDVGVAC